jgi:hypothetical protein
MASPPSSRYELRQHPQETKVIGLIEEDRRPGISTRRDVCDRRVGHSTTVDGHASRLGRSFVAADSFYDRNLPEGRLLTTAP